MEKNRALNHSPSLFDAPGTQALALRNFPSKLPKANYTNSFIMQLGQQPVIHQE